jgi:hypothetical protein
MNHYWRDLLIDQIDFYWGYSLLPRLDGLTDEEYFWEPVGRCWSIRQVHGHFTIDWEYPEPDPPPLTTIAWRMAHISVLIFGIRASNHFGDGSLTIETAKWPGSAESGIQLLEEQFRAWRTGVMSLDDDDLKRPVGEHEPGFEDQPMAELILHLNRETIHHGAEIALLRDLFREQYAAAD